MVGVTYQTSLGGVELNSLYVQGRAQPRYFLNFQIVSLTFFEAAFFLVGQYCIFLNWWHQCCSASGIDLFPFDSHRELIVQVGCAKVKAKPRHQSEDCNVLFCVVFCLRLMMFPGSQQVRSCLRRSNAVATFLAYLVSIFTRV